MKEIVKNALSAISIRIQEPVHRDIESTAQRLPRSTALVESSLRVLNESLKAELLQLIDDLSKSKISLNELKLFQKFSYQFIDTEFNKHISYLEKINVYDIGNRDYSAFIDELQRDLTSKIELKLAILKHDLIRKRNKALLEIGKMILSALIGALIGLGIKEWTGQK